MFARAVFVCARLASLPLLFSKTAFRRACTPWCAPASMACARPPPPPPASGANQGTTNRGIKIHAGRPGERHMPRPHGQSTCRLCTHCRGTRRRVAHMRWASERRSCTSSGARAAQRQRRGRAQRAVCSRRAAAPPPAPATRTGPRAVHGGPAQAACGQARAPSRLPPRLQALQLCASLTPPGPASRQRQPPPAARPPRPRLVCAPSRPMVRRAARSARPTPRRAGFAFYFYFLFLCPWSPRARRRPLVPGAAAVSRHAAPGGGGVPRASRVRRAARRASFFCARRAARPRGCSLRRRHPGCGEGSSRRCRASRCDSRPSRGKQKQPARKGRACAVHPRRRRRPPPSSPPSPARRRRAPMTRCHAAACPRPTAPSAASSHGIHQCQSKRRRAKRKAAQTSRQSVCDSDTGQPSHPQRRRPSPAPAGRAAQI